MSAFSMLNLDPEQVRHIRVLDAFQRRLKARTGVNCSQGIRRRSLACKLAMARRGLRDYVRLMFMAARSRRVDNIVFVTRDLVLYERFFVEKNMKTAIFINYHQTHLVDSFAGNGVFNVGVLVGAIKRFLPAKQCLLRDVRLFDALYSPLHGLLRGSRVYIPCYYDASGLALILNKRRTAYEVIEVQHGGVCNFEPYSRPVSFKAADRFIALDRRSADYVAGHLYSEMSAKIEVVEVRPPASKQRVENDVPLILYCSSIEVNGIHEKFLRFLSSCRWDGAFRLRIRLHPREWDRRALFQQQLEDLEISFDFDESKDWLAGNPFSRMLVVSPWSSVIEEAHRAGIPSVILDDFGKQRFLDLIDSNLCWYADDPCVTFAEALGQFGLNVQPIRQET